MIGTIVAVIGTLMGAVIAGVFQHLAAGRSELVARREKLSNDRREAVTALCLAVSEHRSILYRRVDAELRNLSSEQIQELRTMGQETRLAVTRPLVTMRLLINDVKVREAADRMISLTYAMRNHGSTREDITAARLEAVSAHDGFVDVASAYLLAESA